MRLRAKHGVPDPERRAERDERERGDHRRADRGLERLAGAELARNREKHGARGKAWHQPAQHEAPRFRRAPRRGQGRRPEQDRDEPPDLCDEEECRHRLEDGRASLHASGKLPAAGSVVYLVVRYLLIAGAVYATIYVLRSSPAVLVMGLLVSFFAVVLELLFGLSVSKKS